VLPEMGTSRYHAGHDPRLAEALVNDREAASIAAIFREVRSAIYAGEYEAGDRLPTRAQLATLKGVSAESIGIVMRMLAAEGLVSSEQGRGTFALSRRRFRVRVIIGTKDGSRADPAAALAAIASAVEAEPAASAPEAGEGFRVSEVAVSLLVETGGLPQAVSLTMALIEEALRRGGWDIAGASVTARPA
jgi:hypothetical protein